MSQDVKILTEWPKHRHNFKATLKLKFMKYVAGKNKKGTLVGNA
jgi:hypothetical protein